MTIFLLFIFFLSCFLMTCAGLKDRGKKIYEPLLPVATVFIGFIGLQLLGLNNSPWGLPPGALDKTIVMAILCILGFWWGFSRQVKPLAFLSGEYSLERLLVASFCLTAFGSYFYFLISRLPEELTSTGLWSGLPVAYLFFAQALSYGFGLACLVYFRFDDRRAFFVAILGGLFYLDRIIVMGRRGTTAEFFFILILAFFFGKGRSLPRWVMLSVMIAMVLMMHSTGKYRSIAQNQGWNAPMHSQGIEFTENLVEIAQNGGEELRNAVYMIETYDRTLNFDFGLNHWNDLVFNFVPAQLVGRELKESLMIPLPNSVMEVFSYRAKTGSTNSGLVDSFGSFWYFGWVKFFIIGLVMKKIWSAAQRKSFVSQLLYMLLIVKVLHTVTHNTHWFVYPWVHMAGFLFPVLLWSRKKKLCADVMIGVSVLGRES